MTHLLDLGYVAPRPSRDLPTIAAPDQAFAERAAVPVSVKDDPLWRMPPSAADWGILARR